MQSSVTTASNDLVTPSLLSIRDLKRRAGKQRDARLRKGHRCCVAVSEIESRNLAQTAISPPFPVQKLEVPPQATSQTPHLDMAQVWNDIMYTPCHNQSLWAETSEKAAYVDSVTKNNPAWTAFLRQEAEEEWEEYWGMREHEAEMRLLQDEASDASTHQAEIEVEHLRINSTSLPMGRWHEPEDDLDDSWW